MKVILSSLITHYKHAAFAAQASNCLSRFITGVAFAKPWQRGLVNYLPHSLRKRAQSRTHSELNSRLVTSIWLPEVLAKVMRSLASRAEASVQFYNHLYDRLSSFYIDESDIFHYVATQGHRAAQNARKKGAIIVVDERGAHPRYQERILRPIYDSLGLELKIPTLSYVSEREKDYQLADYVLVASEFSKSSLISEGVDSKKIFVLPYGVDLELFRPMDKPDSVFRVLYVGRVVPSKGVQDLVNAYRALGLHNSELRVVGSIHSSMADILRDASDVVSYHGHVSMSELVQEYANASVVVLPSYTEGSSLVVYEAMACGKPVIITTNCGAVAEDGVHGFVLRPGNVEALADRIQFLHKNEAIGREMGEAARVHAQQFTWKHYGLRLMEIYRSIMNERHGPLR